MMTPVLPNKLNKCIVHGFRVRKTEEVLSILHEDEFGIWGAGKEFDFLFGVCSGVDYIFCALF